MKYQDHRSVIGLCLEVRRVAPLDRIWKIMERAPLAVLSVFVLLISVAVPVAGQQSSAAAQDSRAQSLARPFTLQVGDVVTVSVWKNDDLGVTVPVRPDGIITLPLVGDVDVLDKTPLEAQTMVSERFREFVTAPAVSVVVNEINSWKVFVLGEVRSPGEYDIIRPTRLLQVLAMAGGWTEYAKKDEIVVLRSRPDGGEDRMVLSVKDITSGKSPDDNILLLSRDTIFVP